MEKNREREWKRIFDAIHDWICLIDTDSTIIRSNIVGERYCGLSATEMIGQKCCKLVHGTEKPHDQCPLPIMMVSGKRELAEIKLKDGRWILVTVDPLRDESGKIIKAVHIIRDITHRISMEIETEKLVIELQNAIAKVDTLSGLIPICSVCKKIRDDEGYWNQLENFIKRYANVDFSHGICPDCAKKFYPGLNLYKE